MENSIVGIILALAAAFTVYRLFFKQSCGCGADCGCCRSKPDSSKPDSACQGSGSKCGCGK